MSEAEVAAVDEGIAAIENLIGKLADIPTPAGPTPREIRAARRAPIVERGELVHPVSTKGPFSTAMELDLN